MESATIGDSSAPLYELEWDNGRTRTTDEIGDMEKAGFSTSISDIVDIARDDPDCKVRIIGFEQG